MCGNIREFDMSITDQTTQEVIRLFRPLTCQGCCCSALYPHCTQALSVSVDGETVGTIRERATWINPVYHVFDSVGNQVGLHLYMYIFFKDETINDEASKE